MREGLVVMVMLWPHVEPAVQAHLCKQFALEPFHTPPGDAVPERDDEIMLRASRGWGEDAVYHVTIKGDGRVILVVVEGPLLGLEDYTIEPAVAAHLFSEFGALGFATRPFVTSNEDAATPQPDVSTLSQRLGSTVTAIEQAPLLVRVDAERFKHLVALVETASHVGEHLSLCPPASARPATSR